MAKYPRSMHLPWSPGGTNDDKRLASVDHLLNQELVLTEKMDGSNVCLERQQVFARSHSGAPKHPSFDALKQLHGSIKHLIPGDRTQLFGEWCYARHSIEYTQLPGYLLLFGVRAGTHWASWDEVRMWAAELHVPTVPMLAPTLSEICRFSLAGDLQDFVESFAERASRCGGEREGVVVRLARGFDDQEFPLALAKHVRANHVQTDDHWSSQQIVKNGLKS